MSHSFWKILGGVAVVSVAYLSLTGSTLLKQFLDRSFFIEEGSHFLAYAAMMFCSAKAFGDKICLVKVGLITFALGFTLELLQEFTANRGFELMDLFANGLGVIAGYVLTLIQTKFSAEFLPQWRTDGQSSNIQGFSGQ